MGWLTPFHCTIEAETKLLPVTVKVNADPPTVNVYGETVATAGAAGTETLKVIEAWPPPGCGFETTSWMVPVAANCVAAMVVVNCEELTKVAFAVCRSKSASN